MYEVLTIFFLLFYLLHKDGEQCVCIAKFMHTVLAVSLVDAQPQSFSPADLCYIAEIFGILSSILTAVFSG